MLADLVDGDDVGVIEVGNRLGLVAEPEEVVARGEPAGQDHLQGDRAIEAPLARLEDDTHASTAELRDQFIVAERADLGARRGGVAMPRGKVVAPELGESSTALASSSQSRAVSGGGNDQ